MPLDEPTATQQSTNKLGILREWVRRLRSGDYQQGRRSLKTTTLDGARYCCLGVLGEIYNEQHPDVRLVERGFLPDDVWATCVDTPERYAREMDPRDQNTWAQLNDGDGLSFDEIANRVERDLIPLHEGN